MRFNGISGIGTLDSNVIRLYININFTILFAGHRHTGPRHTSFRQAIKCAIVLRDHFLFVVAAWKVWG